MEPRIGLNGEIELEKGGPGSGPRPGEARGAGENGYKYFHRKAPDGGLDVYAKTSLEAQTRAGALLGIKKPWEGSTHLAEQADGTQVVHRAVD